MAKGKAPQIILLSGAQLEQLLAQLRAPLAPATYQLVESLLRTLQWIMAMLEQKKATIARLQRMIFGERTEKTRKIFAETSAADLISGSTQPKRKGHGRHGATNYPGAKRVLVAHPKLRAGEVCPKCLKAKLYLFKTPARLVRIVAQPIFHATIFELQRLRCALCGALFSAPAPPEAGLEKYDPSVGTMLAIMRYGAGQPMYRTDKWQNHFGVPLAASTQWELIEAASEIPEVIYERLIDLAAGGQLLHSDDTPMRVESLRQEISAAQGADKRRGIFTTSILSKVEELQVALFFTGQKHAGENLDQLLKRRATDLAKPMHMCDALARNESKAFQTILCNCLLHGRRGFVDIVESFPQECRRVIESLREIYRFEDMIQEQKLSNAGRLSFHQQHSKPVLDDLRQWMKEQIDQKKVEPNSGLGQAIGYMLKRWEPLTRFLSFPGAPLDNNIAERALKMAILHRKNSLSYKTLNGARIGDIFMSLIHTCELNRVNPFDYLTSLQQRADKVRQDPARWLPWNYTAAIQAADSG